MKKFIALLLTLSLLLCGCVAYVPTTAETTAPTSATVVEGKSLIIHYIDVGQADCILLETDGQYMLIDGGNREDGQLVVSYLEQQGVQELEAVVCTHAHEDHVGGLPSVLAVYPTKAVYAPTRTYSSKCFDDFVRYADQQDLTITIPSPNDSWDFGGASVTVLGPVDSYSDPNNTSIVLMVQFGENRFLFTGDMERDAETDLVESGADLKADVLKVGHHGSYTSTSYLFLRQVMPKHAVISCGRDNSYGHPHEDPLSRLYNAAATVYRTDHMGSIIAVSDGKEITFTWEKSSANPENPDAGSTEFYIGNINSKALHLPTCSSLPADKNRVHFYSYDEAIAAGYYPCWRCIGK